MTVSIADVAEYAGVSTATVSRVLTEKKHVSATTRQRVLSAVHELNYHPNRTARRLRSQSSDVLGLIVSDIQNPYFTSVARGVEDAAYAQEMNVLLCNTDEDVEKEKIYLRIMRAEHAAGLIISAAHIQRNIDVFHEIRRAGIAIVLLDRHVEGFDCDAVIVDNLQSTENAINHLLDLGHQRIAMVSGGMHLSSARDRLRGFEKALNDRGITPRKEMIRIGNFKRESGYQLTNELLQLPNPPDAIFAANNLMLLGVISALQDAGVNIPEEVAIIGFDDAPWASELTPPITVVSQPTYQLGKEAFRLLYRRIQQPTSPVVISQLSAQLVIRESCGIKLRDKTS